MTDRFEQAIISIERMVSVLTPELTVASSAAAKSSVSGIECS
jgi:hypothetical protein